MTTGLKAGQLVPVQFEDGTTRILEVLVEPEFSRPRGTWYGVFPVSDFMNYPTWHISSKPYRVIGEAK